jgi:curved DNA-binding protein CbpA
MVVRDGEIENLAQAYRVLNVPRDASARAIKSNYRKLIKRWHPDRYLPGTEEHDEATQMTQLIITAYSRIEDAPLRAGYSTPLSDLRGSRNEASSNPSEPQVSGSWRDEYVSRESGISEAEFLRILARARCAGAKEDVARLSYRRGTVLRVMFGAGLGALFGRVAHPRTMGLSTRMAVIQRICGALIVGSIAALDRPRS